MDSFHRDSMDQCNLWTLDRIETFLLASCFFFVRKASSIAVRKMTLEEIVKHESELKCYICYIDMLAFFSAFCYVLHGYHVAI